MAYRRRQGMRSSMLEEEALHPPSPPLDAASNSLATSSAAPPHLDPSRSKGFNAYEDSRNDSKGFWGVLARKAKAILEDDDVPRDFETPGTEGSSHMLDASTAFQKQQPAEGYRRMDNPTIRRGLDRLTTSLNQIGDSFEKAFEEGRTIAESKTQYIIHETRKLQIRRKGHSPKTQNQLSDLSSTMQPPTQIQSQTNHETQLKATRDVAMATAAKAKLVLRELKTVKADLAFAKERCDQLEEENKLLRENREKGDNPADDDLIRLQLETLLAEKGRLAHENSIYARENRLLREIIEYHQLSMQDVVYLDEGAEQVTPVVYPLNFPFEVPPSSTTSPGPGPGPKQQPKEISPHLTQPAQEAKKGCHVSDSKTTDFLTD